MDKVKFLPNVPYIRTILNLFDYTSRTKRKEFFLDFFLTLVMIGLSLFLTVEVSLWFLFIFLINVYILIPLLSRRIKDTGNTPLWCLLLLIGGLGIFPLFIMCFLKSNESEEKKYVTKGGVISLVVGFISQFVIVPIFTIVFILIGVLASTDYSSEYDQKFKPLENRNSYVFVSDFTFYYQDYELDLSDLNYKGNIRSYLLNNGDVYFVSQIYSEYNYDVYIYKVSLDGKNFDLVGSKSFSDTYNISYYNHENNFYFQVRDSSGNLSLNAYDVTNNNYYNIGCNFTYNDYYSRFLENEIYTVYDTYYSFVVTRLSDLEQKVIDEDILINNEAGKYLIEYDYNVYDYFVDGENIYLEYCLDSDSFMGINYYLLFGYDYEKEELTFISAVGTMIIDNIYKI